MGGGVLAAKKLRIEAAKELAAKKRGGLAAKSLGFTLAEVLITLAIIGVVAALTIPVIVAKYQKQQYYTSFMKAYNTFSNAISMSVAENGQFESWYDMRNESTLEGVFDQYIAPYLKISKICSSASSCNISDDLTVSMLNYEFPEDDPDGRTSEGPYNETFYTDEDYDYSGILSDGTIFHVSFDYDLIITFDTNGIKGPNVIGRDIFEIVYGEEDGKENFWLTGTYDYEGTKENPKLKILSKNEALAVYNGDDEEENCTTEKPSQGLGCPGRLLLEGKMDY